MREKSTFKDDIQRKNPWLEDFLSNKRKAILELHMPLKVIISVKINEIIPD